MNTIKFTKLYPNAKTPTRKHPFDAGLDLYICHGNGNTFHANLKPNQIAIYGTGIAVEIPEGYAGFVWPKSRSNFLIGGGVIDSGYQGEILVKVMNVSDQPLPFKEGDAIAQLIIMPVETPELFEVMMDEFYNTETERGITGGIVEQK